MRNNLARLLAERKMSQTELGRRIGTSQQQVSRLIRGERSLDQKWLTKIALALDCTPDDIIIARDTDEAFSEDDVQSEQTIIRALNALRSDIKEQGRIIQRLADEIEEVKAATEARPRERRQKG